MAKELADLLMLAEVEEAVWTEDLQVFPLRCPPNKNLEYVTLDEALAGGVLEVTEVSEGGSVPTLKVTNKGHVAVLLIAGEQLIGAKQNRSLNVSVWVPADSTITIPVSCVERGRWGYRSRAFGSTGTASHYLLRKIMSESVSAGYHACGSPSSDQAAVWREVDRKLGAMGSSSPSAALEQAYQDSHRRLEKLLRGIKSPKGCNGVVFAFDKRIAGMDLFDKPETLNKVLPKLARAYGIDALEVARWRQMGQEQDPKKRSWWPWKRKPKPAVEGLDRKSVESWLRSAAGARFERFKSPGLGDDVRIESREAIGAGLVVEQQPVHVELFAE